MLWIGIGLVALFLIFIAYAVCAVASAADDEIEQWLTDRRSADPRCDITGQPLTLREQFERDCG